ncbi:hypothetical protein SISNIDRAFT_485297 [Sistotremastrum niveocremeum HHB9708]|uniref:F-box domain-containing protein n=1 Tax=Sistotremastrum niveocremeum HHB9708 TaxID=1314777 RepID=A0A164UZU4_9AGAM|nr:hypothetical protein SISNIDRAFT_485297 [Sistotremastrum niveocremeum HHB9708]
MFKSTTGHLSQPKLWIIPAQQDEKKAMWPCDFQPASSRVWSTPELARLIVSNLQVRGVVRNADNTFDQDYALRRNRSALASLAQVNMLISEVALSVLYTRLGDGSSDRWAPTLINLLSMLGTLKKSGKFSWNFERPLELSGWSRFLRYARFVKTICLSPGYAMYNPDEVEKLVHGIVPEAFLAMHTARPDATPIFPSLRYFYAGYGARVDPSNPFYDFVLQSQLVHLQVVSVASVSNLLSYADRSSNTLQTLHFNETSYNLQSRHHHELLATIDRLTYLTDIRIPSAFVPTVFHTLSSKPNLQRLGITQFRGEAHDERYHIVFPKDGFADLESFTLLDFAPRPHDHLTIASAHYQLRTLHLELAKIELDDYCDYFFKNQSWLPEHGEAPAFDIFEPLLTLSNIRDFGFHTDIPFSLSDEEIDDITQAWPHLENFSFCKDAVYTDIEGPELTPSGLISFAEHCPCLRTLTLAINAEIEPEHDPTETPSFNDHFSCLDLAFSPIRDFSEELALCLASLLPDGAVLKYDEDEGGRERKNCPRGEDWERMCYVVTSIMQERAAGSEDTLQVWERVMDERNG